MVLAPAGRPRKLGITLAYQTLMEQLTHLVRGIIGLVAFIGIATLFSTNRRAIDWKLVGSGLLLQLMIGLLVLHVYPVRKAFEAMGWVFNQVIGFTQAGTGLVFGWLTYLVVRGFFARRPGQIVLGLVLFVMYGSILWGVLPGQPGISWQGHLFGAVGGVLAARVTARR